MIMMLTLCACGGNEAQETAEPETAAEETVPAAEPAAEAEQDTEPEAVQAAPSEYEIALSLIGAEIQELYDEIGEPYDSQYDAGCMSESEGELYYDGFTVYTYEEDGTEFVYDVIEN